MFPDFITELFNEVEGKNDSHDVSIFTLSSCMWCQKCKRFLKDKDVKYKYVDIDIITPKQKSEILEYLRDTYKPDRIAYPFLVCDDEVVVGYNPNQYEELLK